MLRILLTETFKEKCISNLGQEIDKDKSMILQKKKTIIFEKVSIVLILQNVCIY